MKKAFLKAISIAAALAFIIAATGIDSDHWAAVIITMAISLGWIWLFFYANSRY